MRGFAKPFVGAAAWLYFCGYCAGAVAATPFLLDENSVVLITGAAGFLGSELALALHTVYHVKKLICIDNMGDDDNNNDDDSNSLALKEYKRQRVFRLLQAAPSNTYFYRVDVRPSVPEFFDSSEVPVLPHIFAEHTDITHVVHLAVASSASSMVVPRRGKVEHEKAGLMEAILEQLLLAQSRDDNATAIAFVYASSAQVYNNRNINNNPNPPPFREDLPLTTPSDLAGAAKLADELLAQAYAKKVPARRLPSLGLRLFDVYGPWDAPGSLVFRLAEQTVEGGTSSASLDEDTLVLLQKHNNEIRDFVFIDDAVDALMAALQVDTRGEALVVNVGTGIGTSVQQLAQLMKRHPPPSDANDETAATPTSISYADTKRARQLLGFAPQVSLAEGIRITLAWHYDRAFPYNNKVETTSVTPVSDTTSTTTTAEEDASAHRRSHSFYPSICDNMYDVACRRGTPLFPCASECAHPLQCTPSLYDDVLALTRAVTEMCDVVLYTVSLDVTLRDIPSTHVRVSTQSIAYVESRQGHCNLAFVASSSPLYRNLHQYSTTPDGIVQHGYWSLIPVQITDFTSANVNQLELLPKLSPGLFFGSRVRQAVYVDPNVIIDNLPRLLAESNMQPQHESVQGATALLVGKKAVDVVQMQRPQHATTRPVDAHVLAQESAYRMIRMAVIDSMIGDGFAQALDTGLLVHTLHAGGNNNAAAENETDADDDLRLFRCDVFAEIVQWKVSTDATAMEFILGLHDMWSRVVVQQQTNLKPWWIGDAVSTVPSGTSKKSRRLQQVQQERERDRNSQQQKGRRLQEDVTASAEDDDNPKPELGAAVVVVPDENNKPSDTDASGGEHNGFGVVQEALEAVFGYGGKDDSNKNQQHPQPQQRFERPEEEEADDFVVDDDDDVVEEEPDAANPRRDGGVGDAPLLPLPEQDPSSYDVWMGVLSSTPLRFFGRIVSLPDVGVYRVTDQVEEEDES